MDKQEKRRIGKGILGIGILLVMLVIGVGSASADNPGCVADHDSSIVYRCGDLVNFSCTFNGSLTCNSGHGLIVNNDTVPIIIDGDGHVIDGQSPGDSFRAGIYNYNSTRNGGYNDTTIKDLEIKNFRYGILIKGSWTDIALNWPVKNNTIDNCTVHDNGNPNSGYSKGIELRYANASTIKDCRIYNNTGKVEGSCDDGGMGIRLYGCGCTAVGGVDTYYGHHNVTNNTIYNNTLSGIFSKKGCKYCNITYNKIYDNGKTSPGSGKMSGGIRLECVKTDNWTIEYNTVTNNTGPGIFVRGGYNNITHNDVTNNNNASNCQLAGSATDAGYGIFFSAAGNHNNITANRFCNNEYKDIRDRGTGNHGDNNICNLTQNYNDDGTTGCTYPCVHAYKYQIGNNPGLGNPNIEFNTTEYANARVDDDVRACNKTTLDERYAAHRFNFTVREPAAKIDKIKVIWNGKGDHDSATDGAKLRIYNFNSGAYEQLDTDTQTPAVEVTLTGEKTSSISNYINANNVTILVNQTSAQYTEEETYYSHIKTDLAKIVIYFKYP